MKHNICTHCAHAIALYTNSYTNIYHFSTLVSLLFWNRSSVAFEVFAQGDARLNIIFIFIQFHSYQLLIFLTASLNVKRAKRMFFLLCDIKIEESASC